MVKTGRRQPHPAVTRAPARALRVRLPPSPLRPRTGAPCGRGELGGHVGLPNRRRGFDALRPFAVRRPFAASDAHPGSSAGQSAALRMRKSQVRILVGVRARRRGGAGLFPRTTRTAVVRRRCPAWFGTGDTAFDPRASDAPRAFAAGAARRHRGLGIRGPRLESWTGGRCPFVQLAGRRALDAETEVRTLDGQPPRRGPLAQSRRAAGFYPAGSGFESLAAHFRPRGPTDTTPASEAGNAGSTPAGGTTASVRFGRCPRARFGNQRSLISPANVARHHGARPARCTTVVARPAKPWTSGFDSRAGLGRPAVRQSVRVELH